MFRTLECCQRFAAVFSDLGRVKLYALVGNDDRTHRLSLVVVVDSDDGAVQHLRVPQNHGLYLDGVDVVATDDDEVLAAADNKDIAVLVDPTEVTGVEPSASHGVGCLVGKVPVPFEYVGPAGADFSDLAGW